MVATREGAGANASKLTINATIGTRTCKNIGTITPGEALRSSVKIKLPYLSRRASVNFYLTQALRTAGQSSIVLQMSRSKGASCPKQN